MPNWVRNRLFIHGKTDLVKECLLEISSEEEHISLDKIVPMPKDVGDDWYDWCVENWGTKWEISESYEDENGFICFDTAWSTPATALVKLSEQYPGLSFEVEYADEDLGGNCGRYVLQSGGELEYEPYGIREACQIWGYDLSEIAPDLYRDDQIDKIVGDD
jgi:hypothetical protein